MLVRVLSLVRRLDLFDQSEDDLLPFLAAGQQMLCGGAILTLAGSMLSGELHRFDAGRMALLSFVSFAYLVNIGAGSDIAAYAWLLRHYDPSKGGDLYANVNPIVAVLLGACLSQAKL